MNFPLEKCGKLYFRETILYSEQLIIPMWSYADHKEVVYMHIPYPSDVCLCFWFLVFVIPYWALSDKLLINMLSAVSSRSCSFVSFPCTVSHNPVCLWELFRCDTNREVPCVLSWVEMTGTSVVTGIPYCHPPGIMSNSASLFPVPCPELTNVCHPVLWASAQVLQQHRNSFYWLKGCCWTMKDARILGLWRRRIQSGARDEAWSLRAFV